MFPSTLALGDIQDVRLTKFQIMNCTVFGMCKQYHFVQYFSWYFYLISQERLAANIFFSAIIGNLRILGWVSFTATFFG
jgi:hypothetical protein